MAVQSETRLRVRYAETDQMGVVYHANYLVWMELGRVELCRSMGVRYRDMEADGVLLAVAEISCRFVYPARYDEQVVVSTEIDRANPRLVRFKYTMRSDETGRALCTAMSTHVFCGSDLQRCKLPVKYWPVFGIATGESDVVEP